jgi:phosphatidate cytidylyltransferase
MSNLTVRIFSAAVMILLGFCALLLNLYSRWTITSVVIVVGAWELSRLVDRKFSSPHLAWFAALSALALSLPHFPGLLLPESWIWMVSIVTLAGYVLLGFRYLDIEVMAPWILMNAFVCAYMGLWGTRLFALTGEELGWKGAGPLIFVIICVAAEDTGAYAAGRLFGKRKLAPRISAKKTVAGAVGGTISGMILAAIFGPILAGISIGPALLLGALIALASAVGDLFISVLKRYAGAKDTSHLIPGHGGIMDRFDALVFVAPIAWLGLKLLG